MPPTPARHVSLPHLLPGLTGALVLVGLSAWLPAPQRTWTLLLAGPLFASAFAALRTRTTLRAWMLRLLAGLLVYLAYAALLQVLVVWPLDRFLSNPSLGTALLVSTALAGAIAVLWRPWPVFGLLLLDRDTPQARTLRTRLRNGFRKAPYLAGEDRFFSHYLPVSLGLLTSVLGALVLGRRPDILPASLQVQGLLIFGMLLLPACMALVVGRTHSVDTPRSDNEELEDQPARADEDWSADKPVEAVDAATLPVMDIADASLDQALLEAVRGGQVETALACLEAGADPHAAPDPEEPDQRPALILAVLMNDTRVLRAMIAHGADLNRMHGGLAPLLAATRDSYHGRAETVMTLLANGADPCVADADGNTPLHGAALSVEAAVAAMLVDAEADPNALNRAGLTPLATACRAANWTLAGFLLEHGARPDTDQGEPALLAASGIPEDDPAGVQLLLRHKASLTRTNALGRNALMAAALEGHTEIARTLVAAGIDVDAADSHGTTALMEAARSGAIGVVDVLAAAQARVDLCDKHGRDALLLACQSPRTRGEIVRALLDLGADPRAADDDNRHALDHAASTGRWDLVALMDPETPLPANLDMSTGPEPGADTPDHLADALRYGHWAIAATFSRRVREWAQTERAHIYLVLADASAPARRWLFQHGLVPDAPLADGTPLLDALLDALPDSAAAIHELLDRGASCAGGARLARTLAAAPRHPDTGRLALRMLDAGADPFAANSDGMTPLHLAAAGGQTGVVEALLALGCNPNVKDATGRTPLHAALQHPHPLPQIRTLISAGADPESPAANNETPLGAALDQDRPEWTRWLRWDDAWPLPHRPLRASDLPAAAATGDNEAVCKLLELGFAADSRDSQGASALLRAAGMGHADTVRVLIEHGADLTLSARSGVTALAAAANAGRADIVSLLLDSGAQIDQPLPGRTTAMMLAVARGHVDIVRLMLAAGADIHVQDMYGRGVLHPAAQFCFAGRDSLRARRMLDLLLHNGADARLADQDGRTPLLLLLGAHARPGTPCDATHIGALVPALLEAGADPRHADRHGITPLHACAMHMLIGAARLLLAQGASRAAVDAGGRTASDLAHELGYLDVAVELESRGSEVPGVRQTLRHPAAD